MATVTLPARCAVAVICGDQLISQVYPASVPVEVFLDNIVELLNEDLRRRGGAGLDPAAAYELHRANGARLDITRSLEDLGIEDGMALVLAPATDGDSFDPQCESLSTSLADAGRRLFQPVNAETAAQTALAILGLVAMTVVGLAIHTRLRVDSALAGFVAGGAGLLLAAGGIAVWRWWPGRRQLLTALAWSSVLPLTVGVTLSIPGTLGAAHLFVAGLSLVALTAVTATATRSRATSASAVITLGAVAASAAAIRMFTGASAQQLGIATLVGLLFLLTVSPTIALWTARIRPPHFGSITGRDLFRRNDGLPVDVVAPVDDDDEDVGDPDTTPSGDDIADAARRANSVLTGICAASAIALPGAIWATLAPGAPFSNAAALLSLLFVVIVIIRARTFSDRRQAIALVCGSAAGFCAGAARYVIAAQQDPVTALCLGAILLLVFAAAGLAAGLAVPATRFTPLVRMLAEWLELVAIVAALPLAAWIIGLFAWVRMR